MISGCTRVDLSYRAQEGVAHISLDWEDGFEPEGSRFYFYPSDGGSVLIYDAPASGFHDWLPVGSYRVLVHNNDSENVAIRNTETYGGAEFYVLPEGSRAENYVLHADEVAYATHLNEVETLEVPYRDTVRVTASPQSCVKTVHLAFEMGNVPALASFVGSLSGVSPALSVAGARSTESASVHFTADPVSGSREYTATVTVLDLIDPQVDQQTHVLELVMTGVDGTEYPLTLDLTAVLDDMLSASGGSLNKDTLLRIALSQTDGQLVASVRPWDDSGTGGGII